MIDPRIEYEFYSHCNKVVKNSMLALIVKNLGRGIDYKTKLRIAEAELVLSPSTCLSCLITWGLQFRKEKTGNLTLLLVDLIKNESKLVQWKENFKQKEEELNLLLKDLALPQIKLSDNYQKNYFDLKRILSESKTLPPLQSKTSIDS